MRNAGVINAYKFANIFTETEDFPSVNGDYL
jgi:hypothetical protein